MNKMMRNKKTIFLFIIPALILFTLIIPVPLLMSLGLSFFKWDLLGSPRFIGLQNFIRLFTKDEIFLTSIKNTFIYLFLSILFQIPAAYFLSIFLTRGKKFERLVRNTIFLPAVISATAVSLMFYFIYHPEYGILNAVLKAVGQKDLIHFWLADKNTAMICICLAVSWQWIGYHMIIFVTGITAIPTEIIEAAKIDGANTWQVITNIITPNMKNVLKVSLVLITTSSFKAFDSIYVMTGGGPSHQTEVMASHMYEKAFHQLKYGYGCAIGLVLFVCCLIFSLIIQHILRDKDINKPSKHNFTNIFHKKQTSRTR
jgi:raffinose/stachyose/melibiose transport system permease protein